MHEGLEMLIRDHWNPSLPVVSNLKGLTHALQHWNTEIFGNIFNTKRTLLGRIEGIQKAIDHHCNPFLLRLESTLLAEYYNVLRKEEVFWFQKSRVEWMALGDRNTRFYHLTTINPRKKNKIARLKINDAHWSIHPTLLQTMFGTTFRICFLPLVQPQWSSRQ